MMLKYAMNDVKDYDCLMPGWDGEGASDISDIAIEKAVFALRALELRLQLSQKKFSDYDGERGLCIQPEPCPMGGVRLFASHGDRNISLAFYRSSLLDRYEGFIEGRDEPVLKGCIEGTRNVIELIEWLLQAVR
jgi:hypothetical protein